MNIWIRKNNEQVEGITSIITVNFRQPQLTVMLLQSLKTHTCPDEVQLIVVDNGAVEDQEELFRAAYPDLVYLRSEKNIGFAGGNNLGLTKAKGEYILFLNNDVEIEENIIPVLCRELDNQPDIGLLSPLILFDADRKIIQYAGYTPMNYFTGRNRTLGTMEENHGQFSNIMTYTGFCHGAAMIGRRQVIDQVGLMDESYFLYYEELDWCEKFRRAGWKMGFTGKTTIYHKESMTVGRESPLKTYFMTRNRWLFIRRNAAAYKRMIFGAYYLFIVWPLNAVRYLIKGRYDLLSAAWKGIKWNIQHRRDSKVLGIQPDNV